jgi:hypothetical protein
LAARARPCAARTRLFELIVNSNGALRATPSIAASLLLIRPPKIYKIHKVLTYVEYRAVSGIFQNIDPHPLSTRHQRRGIQYNLSTIKSIELGPPTLRAFVFPLDHRGNILGSKLCRTAIYYRDLTHSLVPSQHFIHHFTLYYNINSENYIRTTTTLYCTGATIRPNFFLFFPFSYSFWILSFCYSLLFLLFLSLLSLLVGVILCFLIILLLYFKLFVVLHVNDLHKSVILRGFSRGPSLF